jgi:serine/threonine-protein kinase
MSPEQAMGKALDARSDLFSLGIVLWELCTRQRLFVGDTEIQLLMKVQRCEVEPPSRIVDGFPRRLEDIILKCLAADPEDRYADGERLADDLMEFQRTHLGAVSPRNKLAKKVATYLREHPAAPLDDASSSFSGEKTIAAPAVEATMAFTRANQAVSSRPNHRRRRQMGALAMTAFVAAALGLAWQYGIPGLRNSTSRENAPEKAAMLPPPAEKTLVVPTSPASRSKQPTANETFPPAGPAYRSQSETAKVGGKGRAKREPFGEPEVSAQPEKLPAVAVRQPVVSPRREGHASLKEDAPPPTYMKVGKGNSTYMQVGKPEAPSQTSPPPPEAEAETPAANRLEASASLSLNASPWARVYIDGVAVAESTPLLRHSLAAGKHKIVLVNPELRLRRELELELKPGEHHRQTISLE